MKVHQESEARLDRALEVVQRQCLLDSNRVIAMYQAEKDSEKEVQSRFKEIVEELHASWAQRQTLRAKHIENTTSAHYKAVIDHLERQLSLSLNLQSEVDKKWLEELETRSRHQAETLYAFEEKCKALYNERFKKYVKVSNKKLKTYEKQLLEVGTSLASEKNKYDSRLHGALNERVSKWKRQYQ